jgi:hypothetical protein
MSFKFVTQQVTALTDEPKQQNVGHICMMFENIGTETDVCCRLEEDALKSGRKVSAFERALLPSSW